MKNPWIAAIASIVVPGLGQIYAGKSERGAAILLATIGIGVLTIIWQAIFIMAKIGAYEYPFYLYRIFQTAYVFIFWAWQVSDAYKQAKSA